MSEQVSNIDFVVVESGPSLSEVIEAVARITDAPIRGDHLDLPDPRAGVLVVERAQRIIVRVYYAGDVEPRQTLSRRIYDGLAETTDWDLTLDSDDAEDVIASRSVRAPGQPAR